MRDYFSELNRATQTGDLTRLEAMVAKSCPCYRTVRVIKRLKRKGYRAEGISWEVSLIRAHDVIDRSAQVEVKYRVPKHRIVDDAGQVVEVIPSSKSHYDFSVIKGDDQWFVTNLVDLAGGR